LWLGFDRATLVPDARWLKQVSTLEVQIVGNAEQALAACQRGDPLACIVEFELGQENGVRALERLREHGMLAPAVLLTHTAELAVATLAQSRLIEAVPVFSRAERHAQLREWLGDLQTCLSVPA
jgi:ActR/RegA family two-component response regulator